MRDTKGRRSFHGHAEHLSRSPSAGLLNTDVMLAKALRRPAGGVLPQQTDEPWRRIVISLRYVVG